MLLIQAILAFNTKNDHNEHLRLIRMSVEEHLSSINSDKMAKRDIIHYYIKFNPDFLVLVANEFLKHRHFTEETNFVNSEQLNAKSINQNQGLEILDLILCKIPHHVKAFVLMAKIDLEAGQMRKAFSRINSYIHHNPNSIEAHLLLAQAKVSQGELEGAQQCLEDLVSIDFRARDYPLYKLIKSKCIIGKVRLHEYFERLLTEPLLREMFI